MITFLMFTRLAPGSTRSPREIETLEKRVITLVRESSPDVEWLQSLAVLGPYDHVDLFRAEDLDTASRVSTLVRALGNATTELWPAVDWELFDEPPRINSRFRGDA